MRAIYLDYAATTPIDPEVLQVMLPYFSKKFANPGSTHKLGQEAFSAIYSARKTIADSFGCQSDGVIFTASATEANNLVIRGVILRAKSIFKDTKFAHIITTQIEHDSVLEVCKAIEKEGLAEVSYLAVSKEGIIDPKEIEKALRPETVLVSVMYANNETGTIQPIAKISEVISNFKNQNPKQEIYPLFHTDASQAVQFLDCNLEKLAVDFMTISSHKIYGPKGAAALLLRSKEREFSYPIHPIIYGGGQEHGLRSGTENVPAILGFAKAVELAMSRRKKESKRLTKLRDYFISRLLSLGQDIFLNGSKVHRLPNNINVSFVGISSESMLTWLDLNGIAASAGSACESHAAKPSHVLKALGLPEERIKSAIRFSLGRYTRKSDLNFVIGAIKKLRSKTKKK